MKRRVILVHGFNVTDGGKDTIGQLQPYFEQAGFEVRMFKYGWLGLIGVRFLDGRFAQMLGDLVNEDDVLVGHSNGCALIHLAAKKLARFERAIYINPALDRDAPLAPQIKGLQVWHSPSDKPVLFAQFLPGHPWGDMGRYGYLGRHDPRIENFNKENGFEVVSKEHSDVFSGSRLNFFGPLIVQKLKEKLS